MKEYTDTKVKKFNTPYEAGFDAGLNGADNINSHFKYFSSKESMEEWNRGNKNAKIKNGKP